MSRFKHATKEKPVPPLDPAAVAAFAAGAETRTVMTPGELLGTHDGMTEGRNSGNQELRPSVITAPEAVEKSEISDSGPQKKLTLFLDRQRWIKLKLLNVELDKSGQVILVEALDDYFRKHGK